MFVLKIKNARGEIFELTHDAKNYYVSDVQGLTPPPTAVITTSGGALDGSFYGSSRVEQRNIVLTIVLNGDIEQSRHRIYKIFNLKKPCEIYFKNQRRNIKITGYVETLEANLFSQREEIQISIICPRPYFKDLNTIYTELSKVVRKFEFPFSITTPVPFSEIIEYPLCTINNTGDVECGCELSINFTNSVTDLKIYNSTKQEFFGIDYNFVAGDEVVINTNSGEMAVTLTRGGKLTNLINYVTRGSTWFKLDVGENDFTFTSTNGDDLRIIFATAVLYGGV